MGPVIWLPKVAHAALQILPAMAMHEVHAVHLGHAAHIVRVWQRAAPS